jgi:hypothetical protein
MVPPTRAQNYIVCRCPPHPPGAEDARFLFRSWRLLRFVTLSAEMHRVRVRLLLCGTLRAEMLSALEKLFLFECLG